MFRFRVAFTHVATYGRLLFPRTRTLLLSHQSHSYLRQPFPVRYKTKSTIRSPSELSRIVLTNDKILGVEQILLHKFNDRALLAQALTHRSVLNHNVTEVAFYQNSSKKTVPVPCNNERLELLGDKVLGMLVVHLLFDRDANYTEGKITELSQSLVSRKSADQYCRTLGLDTFLLEQPYLRGTGGSRYGDLFEAILGALFLDGGYNVAKSFFETRVAPIWSNIDFQSKNNCKKRLLQEHLVSHGLPSTVLGTQLRYISVSSDHDNQKFTQSVELFGRRLSTGDGDSRQEADQIAAGRLLNSLERSKTTCLLIRLARNANDKESLSKLQAARAAQVAADKSEVACNVPSQ